MIIEKEKRKRFHLYFIFKSDDEFLSLRGTKWRSNLRNYNPWWTTL